MRVLRSAVARKDARTPGYRAAVEAAATGGDETHYEVPGEAYRAIVKRHGGRVLRIKPRRRFALGDAVETVLSSVGITKELVQKITRKPCGCPARQRWLNQWGYRQQDRLERVVKKAAKWYGITG